MLSVYVCVEVVVVVVVVGWAHLFPPGPGRWPSMSAVAMVTRNDDIVPCARRGGGQFASALFAES